MPRPTAYYTRSTYMHVPASGTIPCIYNTIMTNDHYNVVHSRAMIVDFYSREESVGLSFDIQAAVLLPNSNLIISITALIILQ